ncbi:MAG: hypothetical protein JSW61_03795 [Candidatus Thorarchaeota archaeon]|nr:MAG: hypothetical protein JSW61_03795 [Candidatus Thorarchaeota archaeon]
MDLLAFPTMNQILLVLMIYLVALIWRNRKGSTNFVYAAIGLCIAFVVLDFSLVNNMFSTLSQYVPTIPPVSPTPHQVYSNFLANGLVPVVILLYLMTIEVTFYNWRHGLAQH